MPEPEIKISDRHDRFPEKRAYSVSAEEALQAMQKRWQNYRFAVLPLMELTLREKYREVEAAQSFKQRWWRYVYRRILVGLTATVDNLASLIVLGWTSSPGIGEPDEQTGFYNR